MHERPEPDEVEPTPYLPAWLDGTPAYGREYRLDQEPGHGQGAHEQGPYDQGAYDQGAYDQGAYDQGPYAQGPYAQGPYAQAAYGSQYDAQYEAYYDSPQYGPGDFDDGPVPEYQSRPPSGQQYYPRRPERDEDSSAALVPRPAASGADRQSDAALVPTRRELREVRGRRGLGRPVRILLALALVACLGVLGYWGWTLYEGEPAAVREGSCIAALGGADVKPVNCTDARAKYTVLEVFTGASDPTTCAVVLGATDPMVVHRDGRTDVWCVAPNARAGSG